MQTESVFPSLALFCRFILVTDKTGTGRESRLKHTLTTRSKLTSVFVYMSAYLPMCALLSGPHVFCCCLVHTLSYSLMQQGPDLQTFFCFLFSFLFFHSACPKQATSHFTARKHLHTSPSLFFSSTKSVSLSVTGCPMPRGQLLKSSAECSTLWLGRSFR